MPPSLPDPGHITELLLRVQQGDNEARDAVWQSLHSELHRLAIGVARRAGARAPQATELIQLAFLRVESAGTTQRFESRRNFIAYALVAMRSALLDHVRASASRPEGDLFDDVAQDVAARVGGDLCGFYEVLNEFAAIDPLMAHAAELRAMGYSREETAQLLDLPLRTFERQFARARARLHARMPWIPRPGRA